MFSFARRRTKAALTRLRNVPNSVRANKKALTKFGFRLFVFMFAIAMGMLLVAPEEFSIQQGSLSYQLAPGSISGGYVQFSLGPIGSVNFHTHAVPINLKMNLVLNKDITDGQDLRSTIKSDVKNFSFDAVNAFVLFLVFRVLIIAVIGLAAGITLSNGGEHWFKMKYAKWGVVCFVTSALVLIGISYLTLNRTPDISYTGEIAQDLSRVAPYIEKVANGYGLKKNLLQNFVEGAVILNNQMDSHQDPVGVRILAVSDTHDSTAGMQMAGQIVNNKEFGDISAIILAGDITNAGYSWEAHLFDGSLNIGNVPIYFVGGNHESAPAMKTFQQMGYRLLGDQPVSIGDVSVMGQSDPTAYSSELVATTTQLSASSESLAGTWNSTLNPPDVVVVHESSQAQGVVNLAKTENRYVTVIYGHDHVVGHTTEGPVNLVDCGTGGASGLDGVSRGTAYTYQILDFSSGTTPRLTSITTVEFYGLDPNSPYKIVKYSIN